MYFSRDLRPGGVRELRDARQIIACYQHCVPGATDSGVAGVIGSRYRRDSEEVFPPPLSVCRQVSPGVNLCAVLLSLDRQSEHDPRRLQKFESTRLTTIALPAVGGDPSGE